MKNDALLVDPDAQSRNRLKEATSSVYSFGRLDYHPTLQAALSSLSLGNRVDVVFLASALSHAEVTDFIRQAKQTRGGEDAAYVLIRETRESESSKVATHVLVGADGVLFQPYSVDQLVEITNLATRVKKERGAARERAAIGLVVGDLMTQLDAVATMRKAGFDAAANARKLRELSTVIRGLDDASKNLYQTIAGEAFEKAPLPPPLPKRMVYKGVSSRTKRRMQEKLAERLDGGRR